MQPTLQSSCREEIERLLVPPGSDLRVRFDAFANGNGRVFVVELLRASSRVVRVIVEGCRDSATAERGVLGAVRALMEK